MFLFYFLYIFLKLWYNFNKNLHRSIIFLLQKKNENFKLNNFFLKTKNDINAFKVMIQQYKFIKKLKVIICNNL